MVSMPCLRSRVSLGGLKMNFQRFLISLLGFLMALGMGLTVVGVPASASTIIYCNESSDCSSNNQTAFNNAIASQGLFFPEGLENFSADTSMIYTSGLLNANSITSLNFLGYKNTGGSGTQVGVTVSGNNLTQSAAGGDTGEDTALEIQLPSEVYAFAANISVLSTSGSPCIEFNVTAATFNNSNCDVQMSISSSSDTEFVGVVSSAPLTDVFIGYTGAVDGSLEVKSFEVGEPAPEVATLLMIGTGLTCLGVARRRRLRKALGDSRQAAVPVEIAAQKSSPQKAPPRKTAPQKICAEPAAAR